VDDLALKNLSFSVIRIF